LGDVLAWLDMGWGNGNDWNGIKPLRFRYLYAVHVPGFGYGGVLGVCGEDYGDIPPHTIQPNLSFAPKIWVSKNTGIS